MPPIRFLNHASFLVNSSQSTLVCDPWLHGSAFNNGWDLIWPVDSYQDLNRITHIWYSHEHPDHFSPAFLQSIARERRGAITILYRRTRDKRVVNYCKKLGFPTVELVPRKPFRIDAQLEILCGEVPFYDSWCRITVNGLRILNLNDCPLESTAALKEVAKVAGSCDVQFSQFSYACWIGSPADPAPRRAIASRLLNRLKRQCEILRPKFFVPFASFVYFSHVENTWMNDAMNDPRTVLEHIGQCVESRLVLLTPNEAWEAVLRRTTPRLATPGWRNMRVETQFITPWQTSPPQTSRL